MSDTKIMKLFGYIWLIITWVAFFTDWNTGTPLVCAVVCFAASAIMGKME